MNKLCTVALLAGLGACSSKKKANEGEKHEVPRDAAAIVITVDWPACEAEIKRSSSEPEYSRITKLIAACPVCGDFKPLLEWNTPHEKGGPTRAAIEERMTACDAYCDPTTKDRFLGTLDAARGTPSRAPWRLLGEGCREKLSAVPDPRYMSGAFLALDRIGHKVAEHGGDAATALAAIELTLPAVTFTSIGVQLPESGSGGLKPVPAIAVTVLGDQMLVGKVPRAHLNKDGVTVDLGAPPYPGVSVAAKDLPAALAKVGDPVAGVLLLAPGGTLAQKLADVIAAAPPVATFALGVAGPDSPPGWTIPSAIAVAIVPAVAKGSPVIDAEHGVTDAIAADASVVVTVSDTATTDQLAHTLDALAAKHAAKVAIVRAPAGPKR